MRRMTPETLTSFSKQPPAQPVGTTVSVIIVVWNAKKYALECLASLQEFCGNLCTEVIVVDNASTDGTAEFVEQMFPTFKLIRNTENLGFAKANNIGMEQSSGDYVCLVNSDVKFTSDCISPMLSYLTAHPEVGMVGPKMMGRDGVTTRRSTMRFPTLWNYFCRALGLDRAFQRSRFFGGLLMSDFDHQSTAPVEVLTGWFVLVRRSALKQVGLFDPQFFMYGEDMDWCYRFRQAGQQIVFFAEAEAVHYGGASSANAPLRFHLEQCYANDQYWKKHRGPVARVIFLVSLGLHHIVRLLGASLTYITFPSRREMSAVKLQRSWICLQWATQPYRHPSEMVIDRAKAKN
jgi:hypothetical protein